MYMNYKWNIHTIYQLETITPLHYFLKIIFWINRIFLVRAVYTRNLVLFALIDLLQSNSKHVQSNYGHPAADFFTLIALTPEFTANV